MDVTKPYKFIGLGDSHGPKPYEFIGFRLRLDLDAYPTGPDPSAAVRWGAVDPNLGTSWPQFRYTPGPEGWHPALLGPDFEGFLLTGPLDICFSFVFG